MWFISRRAVGRRAMRSGGGAAVAVLSLFMAACAGTPNQQTTAPVAPSDGTAAAATAEREIALFQQAITALNQQQLDRAEADLNTITKTRPELAGPWVNLALLHVRKKNLTAAQVHVAKALERNPRLAQAHNVAGYLEAANGNVGKAVAHYQKAIELKADYALAHYNIALLNDIYLHDIPTAVQHYKRYLQLTNFQDKKTADWVAELERSLAKGER